MTARVRAVAVLTVVATLILAACSNSSTSSSSAGDSTTTTAAVTGPTVTALAVGDIASCTTDNDERTAALVAARPDPVLLLGDLVYEKGTTAEFARCYDPAWGAFTERAYPTPGNHEYYTKDAAPYYAYFGERAGTPGQGWYSTDLGAWHVISLNSNCEAIGGCTADSPQGRWLAADLAANRARCTLAFWHHPRFSSGIHGSTTDMEPLWQILSDAKADVVLSGHDHDYERFAPKDRDGRDADDGIRQFVVGTGGKSLYPLVLRRAGSEVGNASTYGVLELTLAPSSYSWKFIPVEGQTFTDTGTTACSG